MEQVFAPWRIEWVEREESSFDGGDCVFCSLVEGDRARDRENLLVARSPHTFVLLNNYPYNPGHVMVIPRRHTGDFATLSDDELLDHGRLLQRTLRAIESTFTPDGFNTGRNLGNGSGGSITDHLHTHVVPRWVGDTNFMAVISETKVIVEALEDTYVRLFEAFTEQSGTKTNGTESAVTVVRPRL